MNTNSLWRYPEYIKFYSSYFLGNVGDWFDFFAIQIILAHQFNADANGIVYGLCAYILPMILLASVAGSVADRFNKKWLLILTDFISGGLTLALIFAPSMNIALIFIALRSAVIAFNIPAQQTMSKSLLPDELQLQASSYEKIVFQLCRIIGPMLGAVVIAISSPQYCLGINAISFFISAAILLLLKPAPANFSAEIKDEKKTDEQTVESNFKLCFRLIKTNHVLRYFIPLILLASLFVMMVELQLVILLRDIIPSRPNLLGYVIGFSALGSLITGVWLSRKKHITQFGWYLVLCFLCVAVAYSVMGIYHSSWPIAFFFGASLLSGLGLGIVYVLQPYAIKREIDGKQLGRVSGVISMAQGISYAVGVGIGGSVITAIGARESFLLVGGICLALIPITLLLCKKMQAKQSLEPSPVA